MTPPAAPGAGHPPLHEGRRDPLARRVLASGLPWPLPAVLAWAAGWIAAWSCRLADLPPGAGLAAGTAVGLVFSAAHAGAWRRAIVAAGFPLSYLLSPGVGPTMQASTWLLALAPLALIYPLRAWRDAPFYPTPAAALAGLSEVVRPAPRRVLDAGCGLGHGLVALHGQWPDASLHGVEWSLPMAWLARRRLPFADVARGDMWAGSWAAFDLVYLFQRPETMPRAWRKAAAEMYDGAWFASLEFPVPGVAPVAVVDAGLGRPVHLYRVQRAATRPPAPGSTGTHGGR